MKVIYNSKVIPFPGFKALNLFGVVFTREKYGLLPRTLRHEAIHTEQMKELGYIFFYIIYFFEWLVRLFLPGNAYKSISFEREAYDHQNDCYYLYKRKHYAMWRK